MELARRIAALIVGVIIVILVVLLARWTGERIRERFLTPKPPVVTNVPPEEEREATPSSLISEQDKTSTTTASAIPATGPADLGYFFMGLIFLSGISSIALAHKFH